MCLVSLSEDTEVQGALCQERPILEESREQFSLEASEGT